MTGKFLYVHVIITYHHPAHHFLCEYALVRDGQIASHVISISGVQNLRQVFSRYVHWSPFLQLCAHRIVSGCAIVTLDKTFFELFTDAHHLLQAENQLDELSDTILV